MRLSLRKRYGRWVPSVGALVRRSDAEMIGTVVAVSSHGRDRTRFMSDGASTHHVRVRWASGSESIIPNARLVPAS